MKTPSHVNAVKQNGGCRRDVVSLYTLLTSVENEFVNDCFENKFTALLVMAASDRKEDAGIRRRISLSF